MSVATDFSTIGRLLAAPSRSAMVSALMDGLTRPAGELAAIAGISAATASEHLAVLVDGGLVTVRSSGRHRYVELASVEVAEALEVLGHLCPPSKVRSLRQARARDAMQLARTCYDHLAGRLGVDLHDALVGRRWLDASSLLPTASGSRRLTALGVDLADLSTGRRRLSRPCLDWTERRTHLAGSLGAALADLALNLGWVQRHRADRSLAITPTGSAALHEHFGLDPERWSRRIDAVSGVSTGR